MQKPALSAQEVDMDLRRWGRDQIGGLNLQKALLDKKTSYGLDNPGA
jgi:hypothetical protein